MINNHDLNIDQNNRDYDFGHNRTALASMLDLQEIYIINLSAQMHSYTTHFHF